MEIVLSNVVFCDSVIPLPGKKLVCYGIFNEITATEFPFTYPHFSVMSAWTNGTGFHIQQLKLLNPTKTLIMCQSPEQYYTLEEETETIYVTTDINQIAFTEAGTYYLQVFLDNKLVQDVPLHLRMAENK